MKIYSHKIINLSVETVAGRVLGKVTDFVIDTDLQNILEYAVKPSNLARKLVAGELIITRGQVVEITAEKIIVDDLSIGQIFKSDQKIAKQKTAPSTAIQKNKD